MILKERGLANEYIIAGHNILPPCFVPLGTQSLGMPAPGLALFKFRLLISKAKDEAMLYQINQYYVLIMYWQKSDHFTDLISCHSVQFWPPNI